MSALVDHVLGAVCIPVVRIDVTNGERAVALAQGTVTIKERRK